MVTYIQIVEHFHDLGLGDEVAGAVTIIELVVVIVVHLHMSKWRSYSRFSI